jgi:hypothetical protein
MSETATLHRIHVYAAEPLADVLAELLPLTQRHFAETQRHREAGCTPDITVYERLAAAGTLRVFTVRLIPSELVGYCLMIVRRHHHTNQVRAFEDLLYIAPEHRGDGKSFVRWCDQQLKLEGVEVVQRVCQTKHDHGRMFERMGYDKTEETWSKRLGGHRG